MRRLMATWMLAVMLSIVAVPVLAATAGDPLDANDGAMGTMSFSDNPNCADAERWPGCVPCWTTCVFALMCEAMLDHINDWEW